MSSKFYLNGIFMFLLFTCSFGDVAKDTLSPGPTKSDTVVLTDTVITGTLQSTGKMPSVQNVDSSKIEENKHPDSIKVSKNIKTDTIDAAVIAKKLSLISNSFTTRLSKARAQGYGGGISLGPMAVGLKMKPVYQLVHHDNLLKKYSFSEIQEGYEPLLVMGAFPYGGVGKGLRIGLGGWAGDISFSSEEISDSAILINVHFTYGGILLEKAFVRKNFNYLIGGGLGLGSLEVTRSTSTNAWTKVNDKNDEKADASYAGLSMHTGFTVTLLPWMHIGLDGNAMVMFSANGFKIPGCNGFVSLSPGLRLRIVLGNIG